MPVLKRIRRNIDLGLPSPLKSPDFKDEIQISRCPFPHPAARWAGEDDEAYKKRRNLDKKIKRAVRKAYG